VLRRRERPAVETRDPQLLLKVVRAAFAYRRKTLANSLTLAMQIERERTQSALRALAFSPEIRGEQLDLAAFAAITDALVS
jgi:16S rRNA (adenine1518-N6/adenine1519-N6)-dimethyltransferase